MEPGVFGIWRPVLMLPKGITEHLSSAQLDAILSHELCHVKRRDNLAGAVHMIAEAIFWFYPPVWWVGVRLMEERERACDESPTYGQRAERLCRKHLEGVRVLFRVAAYLHVRS